MTLLEILLLICFFLTAHFIYWHVVLLFVLRRYQTPTISNPRVDIHSSSGGDDIVIGRDKYFGIKKGDVVFRPLHFLDEHRIYRVYSMRLLSLGMPGTSEHGAIYLGQGKVMNVNPNHEPSIHEQDFHEFIQGFDEENICFLRVSDQDTINKRVLDFIRWHQELEKQGKTGVIKLPMRRKKVFLSNATPIEDGQFPYYVTGYNCNSLIQDAFTMAQVPGMDQLRTRLAHQVFSSVRLLVFPNQKAIQCFVQSFFISAKDLQEIAQTIIPGKH